MKTHLGKKAAALLLVLSLAVSLLSVVAIAEEPAPGTEGTTSTSESTPAETNSNSTSSTPTTPDSTPTETNSDPTSTTQTTPDSTPTETNSNSTSTTQTTPDSTPTETTPDSTPAADNALSEEQPAPEQPVAEAPSEPSAQVDTCEDGQHQPDLTRKQEATYTTCSGGYKVDTYPCTVCGALVGADGHFADYFEGDGQHKPGSTPRPANYTECNGGFQTEYYICTECQYAVNADGSEGTFVPGTGNHTLGEKHAPDYTSCGGGYKTEYYFCAACNRALNADGSEATYVWGDHMHTLSGHKYAANYSPCGGSGFHRAQDERRQPRRAVGHACGAFPRRLVRAGPRRQKAACAPLKHT